MASDRQHELSPRPWCEREKRSPCRAEHPSAWYNASCQPGGPTRSRAGRR